MTTFKLEIAQYYIEDGSKRASVASPIFYMCRGAGWAVEGGRLESWMKSHKSEVAITTFICTPTRKQCRLSPEMKT